MKNLKQIILNEIKGLDFYPTNISQGYKIVDKEFEIVNNSEVLTGNIEVKWYIDIFNESLITPLDDDFSVEFIEVVDLGIHDFNGDSIEISFTEEELKEAVLC